MSPHTVLRKPAARRSRGISLVEVMVGLAVGMIASLIVLRSFSASESFRRTLGGTADVVQSASIVGNRLEVLLEEAGASFVQGRNVWGCTLKATRANTQLLPAASFPEPFAAFPGTVRVLPVGIKNGGNAGSDLIVVMAGGSPAGNRDMPYASDLEKQGTFMSFKNTIGFGLKTAGQPVDDLFLSVPMEVDKPGDCQIVQAASDFSNGTPVTNASLGLKVIPAAAAVVAPASYTVVKLNAAASSYGLLASTTNSPSAFHLGREANPVFSLLGINANSELVEFDLLQRRGVQAFGENVVLLKALYGLDNGANGGLANDNVIDEWVSPSAAGWDVSDLMDGKAVTQQKIDQIKAIRVGVVLRSSRATTADAKTTQLVLFQDLGDSKKVTRDLSGTDQLYVYQVFDWVVPLRNMKSIPKS
ncbi:PilW family protein [Zoogloea sp.]|uniref:PilW family protein n=1 Tax=Zoogloea sp. TaxID=49181 RepID=UPI0035AE4A9B